MRSLLGLLALFIIDNSLPAAEWQTLFNGRDLIGWQANNNPASFTIKDGVLRIQAPGKDCAHLFYIGEPKGVATQEMVKSGRFPPVEPGKFKNFELEAVVKAEPNSNGG